MNAYGFVHHSLSTTYIEDMRGNIKYSLNMNHVKARLDRFWILLDNQSTVFYSILGAHDTCYQGIVDYIQSSREVR
jgi:hypothetical protein